MIADTYPLTGQLVGTFTRTYHDRRWGCIVTTEYEVINLGRPDRMEPVDPDLLLAEEPWQEEHKRPDAYYDSIAANHARRHGAAIEMISAYLKEHGPQPSRRLLPLTKWNNPTCLRKHLDAFPDVYFRYAQEAQSHGYIWGLVGVHDQEGVG